MISIQDPLIAPYLTPYRYPQPVLTGSGVPGAFDEKSVDIPFVFRHGGRFHMVYTGYDGIGYQSALAVSDDLLHWQHERIILPRLGRDSTRWDRGGGAVTWMIKESDSLWDVPTLKKVNGRYWGVYHAYPGEGYETGPAQISLIWCEKEDLSEWHRLEEPVFSWREGEAWEKGGLYKACIIRHEGRWLMFYNAKDEAAAWTEQTGVAFSEDLMHWTRYTGNPVLRVTPEAWDRRFVSDPYVVHDGDQWLNFYFGLGPGHAQEGLALSRDLLRWEKVDQPIIGHGAPGSYDSGHAHKASMVYWQGVLYHFYCATRPWQPGDPTKVFDEPWAELRTICVATSKPLEGHNA